MKKQIFAAFVLSVFALPVLADSFYISGDVGQAKWSFDSSSDTDTGFGFAGGYKFNDTFAVELGYRDLGGLKSLIRSVLTVLICQRLNCLY
jgi:opacity protein-like surface antigen